MVVESRSVIRNAKNARGLGRDRAFFPPPSPPFPSRARLIFALPVLIRSLAQASDIGELRSKDGDGRENVAEKVNSRSFNLHRDYSKSLTFSNVGETS